MSKKLILAAVLCCSILPAVAQQPSVPLDQLLTRSEAVLRELDEGRSGPVWDEASPLLRHSMPKNEFIEGIRRDRNDGRVVSRRWNAISRLSMPIGNTEFPPGQYVSVVFVGLDQAGGPLKESVTFKSEGAENWEMTNYVINRASDK